MRWARHYRKKESPASRMMKRLEEKGFDVNIDRKKRFPKRKKRLFEVSPEQHFVLCNGTRIKDIVELAHIIENVSEDDFKAHVNEEKNDFCNWIRDVFNEHELAEELMDKDDKKDFQITLLKHVVADRGV